MKRVLLIVCAIVCSVFFVSAQQFAEQTSSVGKSTKQTDWTVRYKGEINVGYSISGNKFLWDEEYSNSDGEFENQTIGYKQTGLSRPLIETVQGVEIGRYFFVGVGLGIQYYCGKLKELKFLADEAAEYNRTKASDRWNALMLPIFANVKFMYPVNNNFSPFINLGIGGTIGCGSSVNYKLFEYGADVSMKVKGGLYCDFGAGFYYKAFNFSVGLQHQDFGIESKHIENDYEYFEAVYKHSTKINSFYVKIGVNF